MLVDGDASPCGYIVFLTKDGRVLVEEVGYTCPSALTGLAACVRTELEAEGLDEAVLMAPPAHPFALYWRRFGCEVRVILVLSFHDGMSFTAARHQG
jgi:hypothetical protein